MRLMPHQVLQKLSEHARNRAQYELAALSQQRQHLMLQIEEAEAHLKVLETQREQALKVGAKAGMFIIFNEMMDEQREQEKQLESSLEQLHLQEQTILKRWLEHDRQSKAFGKMDKRIQAADQRILVRRQQHQDDDRAASVIAAGI